MHRNNYQELVKYILLNTNINLCLKEETSGWKTDKQKCFGGVLLDMGYHVIDIINTFFGVPTHLSGQFAYKTKKMKQEGLEMA